MRPVSNRYDAIFIDCAPGLTLANESAVRASNLVLVPVLPATLPMRAFEQLCAYVQANRRLRDLWRDVRRRMLAPGIGGASTLDPKVSFVAE